MRPVVLHSFPDADIAERWNRFLADAELPTHYVTPNYFLDPYVRGERFAVLALDGNDIQAVTTGTLGTTCIAGMFSRPQTVFRRGTDKAAAAAALSTGLSGLGTNLTEMYTWQREPSFVSLGFTERESADATSVVMLDLSAGADALFSRFSQTRRNEIRKAERQQLLEVSEIRDDELDEMYAIHRDWNLRKGSRPDTLEQMKEAIEQRSNRRVFVARTEGKVVAGSFYRFCPSGVVEYAANFSLPEFQHLRPNDTIGWHAIKWACGEGFSHFSMGGSHLFLRRFGGEVVRTYRYRRDTSSLRIHSLRESARDAAAEAYRRLPQGIRGGVRRVLAR
jgi:hypothetical protein